MNLPRFLFPTLIAGALLLAGCESERSISNSGYVGESGGWYGGGGVNPGYRGELSEFDVLGISPNKPISEADIQSALKDTAKVTLKRGDTVVLVQSGAQFPDDGMMTELRPYFTLLPLSGVPANLPTRTVRSGNTTVDETPPLDLSLRLAAAQGGAHTLIVYWGILETSRADYATKSVSWVPVVGQFVPDESQQMRIRLKAVVIDVESGRWEMLTPDADTDNSASADINRRNSDQAQVDALKAQAYKRLAEELAKRLS
jgi:hypothetical protein